MEISIFEINGQVIESRTGKPLANLKVEAWDKDLKYNDLLGQTFTDGEGSFSLSFDSTYFREHAPDPRPDLFFKVFLGKRLLKSDGDKVIHNAGLRTEVTIKVVMPGMRPEGKDRISPAKTLQIAEFLQQSDFMGLYGQVREKAGASFSFISDMLVNTVTKMDLTPLKVGDSKGDNVVNQDVEAARTHLESQHIEVNEVRQYEPKLNARSVSDMSRRPLKLKAGQKVDLYEENGKVRYYALAKETTGTTEPAMAQTAEVNKLKEELKKTRQEAADKDDKITKLQMEMDLLRKDQSEIKALLNSDDMIKMMKTINKTREP
jgi:hypothetical protein